MIGKDEIAVNLALSDFLATAENLRRLYERACELMRELGAPPLQLGYHIAGARAGKYRSYARSRAILEAYDFSTLGSIELAHLEEGPEYDYRRRTLQVSMQLNEFTRRWGLTWTVYPRKTAEKTIEDAMLELASVARASYGFIYHMPYIQMPWLYRSGMTPGDEDAKGVHPDFHANRGRWGLMQLSGEFPLMLRDVFPINLLTAPYLSLQVGRKSLEQWICVDSLRGSLKPLGGFSEIIVWRPPVERIPYIREELFRSGVLFYWRFFEGGDFWNRDFSEPFSLPKAEPIPEIYRAEFYADRDPKITR